jgi:hypothetical protein
MLYRVDTVAAGRTSPDIAGASLLSEALQSFSRAVVTGAYDEVVVRDSRAGIVVAEWRREGLRHEAQGPATGEPAAALLH